MTSFNSLAGILDNYSIDKGKVRRITTEWQDYAYRLALELEDKEHVSLYMRLCKNTSRLVLEEARVFVRGATQAKNKGRLFMWKVKELRSSGFAV